MGPTRTEQTKLTATLLNNLALAFMVAGFVAPAVAFTQRASSSPPFDGLTLLFSAVWLSVGVVLDLVARAFLRRLKP
jgi:hypothetical protein